MKKYEVMLKGTKNDVPVTVSADQLEQNKDQTLLFFYQNRVPVFVASVANLIYVRELY